jgi:putative ABC transport system ATP-binding protein
MAAPVASLKSVTRRFTTAAGAFTAVEDVWLDLEPGELCVLTGPSGCGKSTILNIVGLIDEPSEGEVAYFGGKVDRSRPDAAQALRRRHVGFVFQDAGLIPRMSVRDNVLLPFLYAAPPAAGEVKLARLRQAERAAAMLDSLGLGDKLDASVDRLSGGERSRVGLGRALLKNPTLLVCDEPTASLDEGTSRLIVERLKRFAQDGGCVLCASHDRLVVEHADRALAMDRGRISAHEP